MVGCDCRGRLGRLQQQNSKAVVKGSDSTYSGQKHKNTNEVGDVTSGVIRARSVDASASAALSDGLGGRRMVSSCLPLTHPCCVARSYVVSESVITSKQNGQLRADDAERAGDPGFGGRISCARGSGCFARVSDCRSHVWGQPSCAHKRSLGAGRLPSEED